ncbi:MAG: hypothetical protein H6679_02835 [Epsilonproteobacteria bacterium]|nr:hypothetical protein [Campylobacterota bacterium]
MDNSASFNTNDQKNNAVHFAEIVESSLELATAQCWQWDYFPEFGSLVQINQKERTLIGCVSHIQTGSMDPTRYPFPYQKTEDELAAEQPQIFEFLKTTFSVQVLGYQENNKFFYQLPPKPSKIHAFVKHCDKELYQQFLQQHDYLHVLFACSSQHHNLDELLLALLKNLATQQLLSKALLENFCHTFSLLTGNDYRRLKLFLQRVQHLL